MKVQRLIHNYYIDFLKNIKNDLEIIFDDSIHTYEFNYGSKTLHQHKLYNNLDKEYPKCVINLNELTPMDNTHFRGNGFLSHTQNYHKLGHNHTVKKLIASSFRWVKLDYNIVISFENGMDVMNYNDSIIQRFPLNYTFYMNKYKSFIDISNFENTQDWKATDNLENIFFRLPNTDDKIHKMCSYELNNRYKLTNIQKTIDTKNDRFTLNLSFEAELQIPHDIKVLSPEGEVEDIIVSIGLSNSNGQLEFNNQLKPDPVMVSDTTYHHSNITGVYLLNEDNIIKDDDINYIGIEEKYLELIKDKPLSLCYYDQFIDIQINDFIVKTIDSIKYVLFDHNKYTLIKNILNKFDKDNSLYYALKLSVY